MKLFVTSLFFLTFSLRADEYIVKYKDPSAIARMKTLAGVKVLHHHPMGQLLKVELSTKSLTNHLSESRGIDLVVPNLEISVEETKPEDLSTPQWSLEKIRAGFAWDLAGTRGMKTVVVAVIDTGVDSSHPALAGAVIPGFNFVTNRPEVKDYVGHGTHCAGIIAANPTMKEKISGVSPGVSIMPLQFLGNNGIGTLYDGIRASDYAVEKKVDIISASWGAQIRDPAIAQLLSDMVGRADAAGILFVTSAGNLSRDNDLVSYFPGNAPYPSIISVGALDASDKKIPISNFGTNVHIAAPGHEIISTVLKGKYAKKSGTSMATPLVAGLAALMKSVNPRLTPPEIRDILQETGVAADMDNACGCRIDALNAIERTLERNFL